ncbi:MAG: metallophosphoesterase family protein [Planctomycetota bacterium]
MSTYRLLLSSMAVTCAVSAASALEPGDDFRVYPYLQSPSDSSMIINWFTETETTGEITISGGDLGAPIVLNPTPEAIPILQGYDDRERNDSTSKGYRLFNDGNWKHQAALTGLSPDTTYNYSVNQNGTIFDNTFKTAPTSSNWDSIRFIAMSDSETEPRGNTNQRDWSVGAQAPGSLGRPNLPKDGSGRDLYPLTETVGYQQNMRIVNERNPDFVVMPGDLVQGGGYQSGWDEFWRHNAGEYDTSFSNKPLLPAYGNWENFAAVNGGYGSSDDRTPVAVSRHKYKAYFDLPENGTPEHQDNYYRIDYGPVTIITLDSSNGLPDQTTRRTGTELDTDTQVNYTAEEYAAAVAAADPSLGLTNDVADFNPGSVQYQWAEDQIRDARDKGQMVFVQWHNAAYSSGTHGFPMSHPNSSGQGGTPFRQYHPLFEELGVAAVLSGHSEMFERSFIDEDGDGIGVNYYDVGVSGDGMRGRAFDSVTDTLGGQNPFSEWTADGDEGELWQEILNGEGDPFIALIDGGKHYGHLEVNVENLLGAGSGHSAAPDAVARIILTPVYSFPNLDENFELVGDTERRIYGDEIILYVGADGSIIPEPASVALVLCGLAVALRRRSHA